MVSWSDDNNSENSHQYVDSASDEGIIKIPETMDDSDFEGTDPDFLCNEHSLPAERRVYFQGIHTGRRFFACAVKDKYDMLKNLIAAQANVIRNMKLKLAEEKIKLQAHISELEKVVEQTKLKLNGIKTILDE
ncbi:hypothetical protein VPH35_113851 [Triticum aestivum]